MVLCHGVLEVVDDPAAALATLREVLRPGGTLSLLVAQRHAAVVARAMAGHFAQALALLDDPAAGGGRAGHRFTDVEIADLLARTPASRSTAVHGVRIFADLVPGSLLDLEPGATAALVELERAVSRAAGVPSAGHPAARAGALSRRPGAGNSSVTNFPIPPTVTTGRCLDWRKPELIMSGDDLWGGTVPLSEEELRLLEQMERALVEEDPKLASTLRGTAFRRSARRRAIVAGACFVLGVAVLMTGAVASITVVGIVGFVIMLGSATIALDRGARPARSGRRPDPRAGSTPATAASPSSTVAARQDPPPAPYLPRLLHGADGRALAPSPRGRRLLARCDSMCRATRD